MLLDPDREKRIEALAKHIKSGLHRERQSFKLSAISGGFDCTEKDVKAARDQVFRGILSKAWQDHRITQQERETIAWVTKSLEMTPREATEINLQFARDCFSSSLHHAMQDGKLQSHEEAQLAEIAAGAGFTLPQFMQSYFRYEGQDFLRSIFLTCINDGTLTPHTWHALLTTTTKLGLTEEEVFRVIEPQARQFVEHVLADAKSDGVLSPQEERTLNWMISHLHLHNDFRQYVAHEITTLRQLATIAEGKLTPVPAQAGILLKAGEIVYFSGSVVWEQVRQLKRGPVKDQFTGVLTVSDNRLVFSSPTKSHNLTYRCILSHHISPGRIIVQASNKPAYTYWLEHPSPIPGAIFSTALQLANQTIRPPQADHSRNISRNVRQRVWVKYAGRCAECGATDYLEFDHIIPVAKGGSNGEANVQLLCRRCNLQKSDLI